MNFENFETELKKGKGGGACFTHFSFIYRVLLEEYEVRRSVYTVCGPCAPLVGVW